MQQTPTNHEGQPLQPVTLSQMKVDLAVSAEGAWILHDHPLPSLLKWAEYDAETAALSVVLEDGIPQDIGMRVHPELQANLKQKQEICVTYMKDGKAFDYGIVPLIVHNAIEH